MKIKNVDLNIFWDINKDNDTFIREINYQQMRLENSKRKTLLLSVSIRNVMLISKDRQTLYDILVYVKIQIKL